MEIRNSMLKLLPTRISRGMLRRLIKKETFHGGVTLIINNMCSR
tara:strand:- start:476 stop:607 length:132 start_codon:yes stop_codon:yes gene_type:complete